MTDFKKRVAATIAAGSILLQLATPVLAQTTIEISGNGADSVNDVDVAQANVTVVAQTNTADISNKVDADADTGNNNANRNTGGDVDIDTGDASTTVGISNTVNSNEAEVGCCTGDTEVLISGNGSESDNHVDVFNLNQKDVFQDNRARIVNYVDADADTGNNDANRNTGGNVSIDTGDASTRVDIDNMANFNFADLDCGCLLDLWAKIAGNGSDSDNHIRVWVEDVRQIFQDNDWSCGGKLGRRIRRQIPCNNVDADADTGGNDANRNTGDPEGDPSVETGNADTEVLIENAGNVNTVGVDGPDLELSFPGGFSFNLNLSFSLSDLLALLGLG